MIKPRCCIHIGLPKTASKTLQWHLFARHSQIEYLGRFIGKPYKRYRKFEQCRDSAVQTIMREIAWGDDIFHTDIALCQRLFAESIAPAVEEGRVPVWSWESLSEHIDAKRRARAENLRTVFGECKVFIMIRQPVDLIESVYFQILRRENINRNLRMELFGKYAYYFTIDQWLEKCFQGEIMPHLEYAKTIEMYAEIFGRDAVAVYLFEDLQYDASALMESICRFIGVDPIQGNRLIEGKRENPRWTVEHIRRLQQIDRSAVKSLCFRFCPSILRYILIGSIPGSPAWNAPRARAEISQKWRERIEDITREGNRWLAEDWDLPLERYGYPL